MVINAGPITGYFTADTQIPPELKVGEKIEIELGYYVVNPGALYWKTFIILSSPQLEPTHRILDATREWGSEAYRVSEFNLGRMPDKTVSLSCYIFAHDEAGYDWDWENYYNWLNTGVIGQGVIHIGSHYASIAPTPNGNGNGEINFLGNITDFKLKPGSISDDVKFLVSFNARAENAWDTFGWETRVKVEMGSYYAEDRQNHIGYEGNRVNQEIRMGAVDSGSYQATVTLEAKGLMGSWETLNQKEYTVNVGGNGGNGDNGLPPDGEKEIPWAPILGASLLAAGIIVSTKQWERKK